MVGTMLISIAYAYEQERDIGYPPDHSKAQWSGLRMSFALTRTKTRASKSKRRNKGR